MEQNFALNESLRRNLLKDYNIAPSTSHKNYDQITFLAATICNTSVAYIAIIGIQKFWFKSPYGIEMSEIEKKNSFSKQVILSKKDFFSINYSEDPLFFEGYSKEKNGCIYKFYAGVPLINPDGFPIGVLSILDKEEKQLEEYQIKAFKAIGNQCMNLFEFRKQSNKFQQIQDKLKQKYQDLEKFASLVSHDLKSPLANIISLTELLKEENENKLDKNTLQYLDYLVESSYSLRNYVDGILSFYRSDHILEKDNENVDLNKLLKGIAKLYNVADNIEITYPENVSLRDVNKAALTQIFLNLISNALKYNHKPERKIWINFHETPDFYYFEVKDNGDGFPEDKFAKIFDLFTTLDTNDREGNPGSGIGLATVKKMVESMGGSISVNSVPGKGSTFQFTIKRI